ncbi:MAG: alpha/beta fold hydrolase [Dinoroseobacter sp.]|nr:alpha/beta fold hydrolase [Dinoroseobacter sp.]
MDWTRDLPSWSHPSLSRRIDLAPHRWHVQTSGSGPTMLLLPGAGSSVHTWRDLIPKLSETHHVVALDLPGQGFTRTAGGARSGLKEMSADIAALLSDQNWRPEAILCHSAGAAIGLSLSRTLPMRKLIGINPALDHFQGIAGWLFPAMARFLAISPLSANLLTLGATPERSRQVIEATGSLLTDEAHTYYARLMRDRAHVAGTLNMMARWSLDMLLNDLEALTCETLFLTGEKDTAVPPSVASKVAHRMRNANVEMLDGVGHLAHEEDPARVLSAIKAFL